MTGPTIGLERNAAIAPRGSRSVSVGTEKNNGLARKTLSKSVPSHRPCSKSAKPSCPNQRVSAYRVSISVIIFFLNRAGVRHHFPPYWIIVYRSRPVEMLNLIRFSFLFDDLIALKSTEFLQFLGSREMWR